MRFTRVLAVGLVAAMAAGLVACGGTKITELSVDPALSLGKGDTYQFEIAYKAKNEEDIAKINEATKNYVLQWASSNELVATVDENGNVTAVDIGDAVITVSVKDHKKLTATCEVTVENKVKSVSAAKSLNLVIGGDSENVKATVNPKDAENYEIRYKSSDEKVATVDKDGNVTAVSQGACCVTTTVVAKETAEVVDEAASSTASSTESKSAESVVSSEAASSEAKDEKAAEEKETVLATATTNVTVTPEGGIDLSKNSKSSTNSTKTTSASKNNTNKGTNSSTATSGSTTPASTTSGSSSNNSGSTSGSSGSFSGGSSSGSSNKGSSSGGSSSGGSSATPATPNPAPAPTPATPNPAPAPAPDPAPEQPSEPEQTPPPASDRDNKPITGDGGTTDGNGGDAEIVE